MTEHLPPNIIARPDYARLERLADNAVRERHPVIHGAKRSESKVLVCPEELRNSQIELSVLSPLGAAVLELSIGHRMKFFSIDGGAHCVIVEDS